MFGVFLLLFAIHFAANMQTSDKETLFRLRSVADWEAVWHKERYRRCNKDLLMHMQWVCYKDIYKMDQHSLFENPRKAHIIFQDYTPTKRRRRGIRKGGIMEECCHTIIGCSWEEYAEYCPINRRIKH
ncbi:insulin-like peptide 7 [Tachypleus tridentatus]|uniref:insulin-like peptide 7 n=1 Tax=Tachypleus tridentatus TaxID=6853 RepID=UPI003FD024FB